MDSAEELNGTAVYAKKSNLTATELLFMIFCENTASQFDIGVTQMTCRPISDYDLISPQ